MEYLALYRKYRPKSLNEMVGQTEIRKILSSSIANNTISHAYLFSGPRGTGKTSTAKIFAKMVNCENLHDGVPCDKCASCLSIQSNSDVVEIDAASNNGVDEIRELREKANLVPGVCKYKVYIIDEVHMLTTQAFNALLKILEEPPKHIIFILATTEYHKVPSTIVSRCQKFKFSKISVDDNVSKLREISVNENIDISDDALKEIANISDGGMRDSINFLDQIRSFKGDHIDISDVFDVCGSVSLNDICNLLVNISKKDALNVSLYLESIGNCGKSYNSFLEDVLEFFKDVILFKDNVSYVNIKSDLECVKLISSIYTSGDIFKFIKMINELTDKLRFCSRQSVVVVTNFLIIMNQLFNNEITTENNSELHFDAIKDKKNTLNIDTNNLNDSLQLTPLKKGVINSIYLINKDIIVNNSFALADKKLKNDLIDMLKKVSEYLLDSKYSLIASKFNDVKIEVAGNKYITFSTEYDSVISYLYDNYLLCSEFINNLFGDEYYFAFINNLEWSDCKDKYIKDYKNNVKYSVKDLLNFTSNGESDNIINESSIVSKLVDIVGNDAIEYK